ncbi:hypothetical protein L5M36_03365 [Shewanella sp. SM72]|uniref:hypothetical protein n=1 Tax=Shewanella sp. SM72 TaxID=2912805 RepID=UPI0021D99FD2|nr:hypothetical protein [Shewanella sp. SM72]MCU8015938.1 hypothetical protein [Shewanella sp. SM72]
MFKSLFKSGEPYFLLSGEDKCSVFEFSQSLMYLSNQSVISTTDIITEHIPEELLLSKIRSGKPFNVLLLSFEIACFLHSAVINTSVPDEVVIKLKQHILSHIVEMENGSGSIWAENDIPYFNKFIMSYFDSILKFVQAQQNGQLTDGTGRDFIEDLLEIYELPSDSVNVIDKSILSSKLNVNIFSALASFSDGVLQWKNS